MARNEKLAAAAAAAENCMAKARKIEARLKEIETRRSQMSCQMSSWCAVTCLIHRPPVADINSISIIDINTTRSSANTRGLLSN
mmetsp:Transcript_14679/g.29681  ORF Transcript_14679/g.29681 Transcript_14679/m.29681 type:complete len:84 (+) Transcript_14679:3682-3933(+)